MPSTEPSDGQVYALHLLRGIAAILVMLLHLHGYLTDEPNFVPSGHLAVDLFFLLSGFVIAYSYDEKLKSGMAPKQFAAVRLIRLFPLYALSLAIAVLTVALTVAEKGWGVYSRLDLLTTFLFSSVFLPTPPPLSTFPDILYPWNGPAWSLFFELLINFAYGFVAVKLSGRVLAATIIVAALLLVAAAFSFGTLEGGATWQTYPVGFPRVIFSFSLGVAIKRYWMGPTQLARIGPWLLSILCIAILVFDPGDFLRPYDNLLVIIVLWPLVVIAASRMSFAKGWRIVSQLSGDASYGIYVLHIPLLNLFVLITEWDSGAKWGGHGLRFAILSIGAVLMISCWLSYVYDRPIRHRLMQIFPRGIGIARAPTA